MLRLERVRPVLAAEDRLAGGDVPDGELFDLVLAATGDRGAAEAALRDRVAARLRCGEAPWV